MNNHLYHCIYKDVKLKNTKLTAAKVEEDSYDYLNTFLVKGCDLDISIYMVYAYRNDTECKDANANLNVAIFYTGNEKEKYLAKLFNEYTLRLSNEDLETDAKCNFIPVKLENKDKNKQILQYVSGLVDNALQEDACYALSDSGRQTDAFSYEIKPLNTTLSQPGNDVRGLNNNKDSFKFFPGDTVKGYCPFDKKWHKGLIKYLYYDGSDLKMPKYAYIQDFNDESTIAVEANNLKSCYIKPEFQFRVPPGPYDNFRYRPVMEKVYKAIDKGIKKVLNNKSE